MSTSDVVKETLNVAGLSTNIYTRANLRDKRTSEPVVVLFFLHGRTESADEVDPTARAAFLWAAEKEASSKEASRDFMVVTFVSSHSTEVKWLFSTLSLRRINGTTARGRWISEGTWDGPRRRISTTNGMRKCSSGVTADATRLLTSFTKFVQR